MSRSDQHMGMSSKAIYFLEKYEIKPKVCAVCNRPHYLKLEEISSFSGMFTDEYPLHRHQLIDGLHADEYLQCSPWSSGPMFFIGLKISDGRKFTWTNEEVEEMSQ